MDSISDCFSDSYAQIELFLKQRHLEVLWSPGDSVHAGYLIPIGDRKISSFTGLDIELIRSRSPDVQVITEQHFLDWKRIFGGREFCVDLAMCEKKYEDLQLDFYKENTKLRPNLDKINELTINIEDVKRAIAQISSNFIEQIQCIATGSCETDVQELQMKMATQSLESRLKSFTNPIISKLHDQMTVVKLAYTPDDLSKVEIIKSRFSIAIEDLVRRVDHINRDNGDLPVGFFSVDVLSDCLRERLSDFNRLAVENDWSTDDIDNAINVYLYNTREPDIHLSSFKETSLYGDFLFKTESLRLKNIFNIEDDNSKKSDPVEGISSTRQSRLRNH